MRRKKQNLTKRIYLIGVRKKMNKRERLNDQKKFNKRKEKKKRNP